jgi:hypothetical protein
MGAAARRRRELTLDAAPITKALPHPGLGQRQAKERKKGLPVSFSLSPQRK